MRYQCEEMYNGTPTASCGDDGMYMAAGASWGESLALPRACFCFFFFSRHGSTCEKLGSFSGRR